MVWSTVAPTSQESLISGIVGGWERRLTLYLSTSHYPFLCLYSCLLQWPLGHPAASSSSFLPYRKEFPTPVQDGVFSIRRLVFISQVKGKPGKENSKFGFNKDTWQINCKAASDSPKKALSPPNPAQVSQNRFTSLGRNIQETPCHKDQAEVCWLGGAWGTLFVLSVPGCC